MRIVGKYSFNQGEEEVTTRLPKPLKEIEDAIASINAEEHRTKKSNERQNAFQPYLSQQGIQKNPEATWVGKPTCTL